MATRYGKRVGRLDPDAAQRYYNQGMSDAEIAEECRVVVATVARWRKSNNLPLHKKPVKKKPGKKSPLAQRAEEAQKAGMTYGQYMATLRGGRRW